MNYDDDPLRPPGYRFLIQDKDCHTEAEFSAFVLTVFGPKYAGAVKIVAGFRNHTPHHKGISAESKWTVHGFRAYLPVDFKGKGKA